MIKLEKVNKYYNKGRQNEIHAINDISLELPESGIVAIFGKSGCGKTTLLNVIGGLDNYESGNVIIDNNSISTNTDVIRNKYVGYIFQNYNLNNNESCYENVASALKLCGISDLSEIDTRVNKVLENVRMSKFSKRKPDTLSGGQQQRIAIARALVKNPRIILADEPTGNLDENNTIMIMELLKEISKTHLVLLVTHEENLVNHYCDMIVNLSDGKVINIENNDSNNGINIKNKNDIYLGEFEKKTITNDNLLVDYYGNDLENPINIKIVNDNGKVYIKIDSLGAKIIDDTSEIKFKEGEFIKSKDKFDKQEVNYVINELPDIQEVENKKYGKLFNFKDSIVSGFNSYFITKRRKSQKRLFTVLCLFAIVLVIFSSVFGVAFKKIEDVNKSYNSNLFYVRSDPGTYDILKKGMEDGTAYIEDIHLSYNMGNVDFKVGNFSSSKIIYKGNIYTDVVFLDFELQKNRDLIVGVNEFLEENQVVISSGLADYILENSYVDYTDNYSDLLGMVCYYGNTSKNYLVKGIVKESEKYIYMDEVSLSEIVIQNAYSETFICMSEQYGYDLNDDELIYVSTSVSLGPTIEVNNKVLLNGKEYTVKKIIKKFANYYDWLDYHYPNFNYKEEYYFNNKLGSLYPNITQASPNYYELYREVYNKYYYDYLDYLYTYIDEYLSEQYVVNTRDLYLWMYIKKDIDLAKYEYMDSGALLYCAKEYKKTHGEYPLKSYYLDEIEYINNLEFYRDKYYPEYIKTDNKEKFGKSILINKNEYGNFSKRCGETDSRIKYQSVPYVMSVISTNPEKTLEYLNSNLGYNDTINGVQKIMSPSEIKEQYLADYREDIISNLIVLIVLIVIMSMCMYFIMKSQTMSKIKEIGIYRAIGVTKKNYLFKYLIEVIVLTTLTVIVGYVIASLFIYGSYSISSAIEELLFYPWYIAISILLLLYFISIVCGLIPILSLLRKTPSEILAKYDI